MYYIYKFQNKINGKIYIGQTNDIRKRYNGHKSGANNPKNSGYNTPFYRAIRKYGFENFSFDVVEEIHQDESKEYVDSREKFFIKYYESLVNQNGYNVSKGGTKGRKIPLSYEEKLHRSKLFSKEDIADIQKMLIEDEEYEVIEKKYAPKLKRTFLVNINTGANFFNPNFDYPLKKHAKSHFTKREIQDIKNRIKKGEKYSSIREIYHIKSDGFISGINTGKYFYDKNEKYPLCIKGCNKKINEIWAKGIINDILTTDMSLKEISEKWKKSYSTVKNINAGRSHRQENLQYPLR